MCFNHIFWLMYIAVSCLLPIDKTKLWMLVCSHMKQDEMLRILVYSVWVSDAHVMLLNSRRFVFWSFLLQRCEIPIIILQYPNHTKTLRSTGFDCSMRQQEQWPIHWLWILPWCWSTLQSFSGGKQVIGTQWILHMIEVYTAAFEMIY